MVNFKIYDITNWLRNNCNKHNAQYLTKQKQQYNEVWTVNRIFKKKNNVLQKSRRK